MQKEQQSREKTNKPLILIVCAVLLVLAASIFIYTRTVRNNTEMLDVYVPTNPQSIFGDNPIPKSAYDTGGLDIVMDDDYSSIVAYTEYDTYKISVDSIKCIVQNNNVGKGFYCYLTPYIERLEDNQWIRLESNPNGKWGLCGVEGNRTEPNSVHLKFLFEQSREKIISGDYRLVVFVGNEIIYAPFTMID